MDIKILKRAGLKVQRLDAQPKTKEELEKLNLIDKSVKDFIAKLDTAHRATSHTKIVFKASLPMFFKNTHTR